MEEVWVDIDGYDGKYQLSNTGKVISTNYNNTGKPKELKIKVNRYGYNEVCLSKNNKRHFHLVLTLVAKHFLKKPAPDMIPIHIGDINDDSVENIAYGYRSEMLHLMYKKGHRKIGKPTRNIVSYKNKSYRNFSALARDYDLSPRILHKRINRGWTLNEALEIAINRNKRMLNVRLFKYKDKLYSVRELSELSGISTSNINKRLARRWSIEEAVEIPVGMKRKE